MRRLAPACALAAIVAGAAPPAAANGRFPTSVEIAVQPGDQDRLYLALTFGLMVSPDDGCHWYWICEENIGYGGTFDPKYVVDADGTIYATTYDGLRVSRDGGCSFSTATADQPDGPDKIGAIWVDAIDVGPDGAVWVGTAESGQENAVFVSTDQARTFTRTALVSPTIWWKSLKVAPGDPERVYVSGYQTARGIEWSLQRSSDGGASWEPLPLTGIDLGSTPLLMFEGVDPTDPDIVYLRSAGVFRPAGDRLYRSADGGQTWTPVLDTMDAMRAFTIRSDGDVVAGTVLSEDPVRGCTYRSMDRGQTFSQCELGPQMACVREQPGGELYACGANWDPDYFTIGRSTDGASWAPVARFHEIVGPLPCAAGTPQYDTCELEVWPSLREQFGVEGPGECAGTPQDGAPPDGGDGGGGGDPGGCCDSGGGGGPAAIALGAAVALLVTRRRRAGASR